MIPSRFCLVKKIFLAFKNFVCIIKTIRVAEGDGTVSTTGDRIKAARKAKGLTQSELADKVGVKYAAIHKYESGLIVNLKRDMIAKLAEALDVKPSYLLGLDEALLDHISEESSSGRTAAKEEMYRTFSADHYAADLRLIEDKIAVLYYKAMDRHSAPELMDIVCAVEDLDRDELTNIRSLIRAYLQADAPIREIVDTALKPYKEKVFK